MRDASAPVSIVVLAIRRGRQGKLGTRGISGTVGVRKKDVEVKLKFGLNRSHDTRWFE